MPKYDYLEKVASPGNVVLSFAFAFLGSYLTIVLSEQFRLSSRENKSKFISKEGLLMLMACSLGGVAIWSMHQIGMQGISLKTHAGDKIEVKYSVGYLLLSLFAVVICSYVGLSISSTDKAFTLDESEQVKKYVAEIRTTSIVNIKTKMKSKSHFIIKSFFKDIHRLIFGGIVTAAGVCVMHYLGLQSMVFDGYIEYSGGVVFASILIAVTAASAAFWILFRLLSLYPYMEILRIASAFVAMLAVNGMHYCGMAQVFRYVPGNATSDRNRLYHNEVLVSSQEVFIGAIIASMLFLWIAIIIVGADLRAWLYNSALTVKRADELFASARFSLASSSKNTKGMSNIDVVMTIEDLIENYKNIRNLEGNLKMLKQGNLLVARTSDLSNSKSNNSSIHPVDTDAGAASDDPKADIES